MLHSISRAAPVMAYILLFTQWALAAVSVEVDYQATPLGGTRWQYKYDLTNSAIVPPVTEFTILFDRNTQRNLAIGTPNPPAANWNELIAQPDLLLQADGFYDALSTTGGVTVGNHVSGFTVSFDWLGVGLPGSQRFDIIDPSTFAVRYSGTTVPEPSAALSVLMATPLMSCAARSRRKGCLK